MEAGVQTAAPAAVRLVRAPFSRSPTLAQLARAIAGEPLPFVLAGRWGLPAAAPAAARVLVAGAAPSRVVAPDERDPFGAFRAVPELRGDAPAGAIGGGLVGWLGYDLGRTVERTLGPQPLRPQPLPAAQLAWYDDVLRRDEDGVWWVEALVDATDTRGGDEVAIDGVRARWEARLSSVDPGATPLEAKLANLRVRGGTASHEAAIAETIERIHAGELFQANVCLRLEADLRGPASALVAPVLEATDPWYGAWIEGPHARRILSASPELFLRRRGREVVTGPIKGTAPRAAGSEDPSVDPDAQGLGASAKDHAEHVMIVDLMRNDLGRVSDYGSVWHDREPRLEPHAGVWHLVSQVGGRLHPDVDDRRLLRATFPPGSVTGAPKVQAMRVIAAVEGTGREVYTGAHGVSSPATGLELAVTIRTIEMDGPRAWIGAGGGIVADSQPRGELLEALGKAEALARAAGGAIDERPAGQGPPPAPAPAPWMRSADRRPDPDRGLLETLRVEGGRALHLRPHLARLRASLDVLGYPGAPENLEARVAQLAATAVAPARLRILATRAHEAPALLAVELQLIPILATGVGTGPVALAPVVVPGGIGPHKYLDRGLIDTLTERLGATPLLLEAGGAALEAGWANVWWVDERGLATPPLDGRILPGVTRAALLDRRSEAPVAIREEGARLEEIRALPLLLTSSRGVSVARLASTPPEALARATALAAHLAPLVADPAGAADPVDPE